MLKKSLVTIFLSSLLIFSLTPSFTLAAKGSLESNSNVVPQAAYDKIWFDQIVSISIYQQPIYKYFEREYDGTLYRGYLTKVKTAGTYAYYSGWLYRTGIQYPVPASVKPITILVNK